MKQHTMGLLTPRRRAQAVAGVAIKVATVCSLGWRQNG